MDSLDKNQLVSALSLPALASSPGLPSCLSLLHPAPTYKKHRFIYRLALSEK
jgi:hypothetical protein